MTLEPVPDKPGLWKNPSWAEGSPGLFALVIGVSDYTHLPELDPTKTDPELVSPKASGLSKLAVSAITAFGFFDWLRTGFARRIDPANAKSGDLPLAMCWFLAAPSEAEVQTEMRLTEHQLIPTWGAIADSLKQWYWAMRELPAQAAGASRSVFFFSGHGIAEDSYNQILLPSDWLHLERENPDEALSTENVWRALSGIDVPLHFFFMDACQSYHPVFQDLKIAGQPVLPVPKARAVNRNCEAPLLFAAASGTVAYQPSTPDGGYSFFGQAVLEGLRGQGGIKLDRTENPILVELSTLMPFVRRRVDWLLQQAIPGSSLRQRIQLGGFQTVEAITEVRHLTSVPAPFGAAPVERLESLETFEVMKAHLSERIDEQRFGMQPELPNAAVTSRLHDILHSSLRACKLGGEGKLKWLGFDDVVTEVEWSKSGEFCRLHVTTETVSRSGYWLELSNGATKAACLLPTSMGRLPSTFVDVYFNVGDDGAVSVLEMRGRLSRDTDDSLISDVARLWERYEVTTASDALGRTDERLLENCLQEKRRSPLAATVAAIVLLRANRWDRLHDWLRNLSNWYPEIPDAAVLWVEQRLRTNEPLDSEDVRLFMNSIKSGLPRTAEAVGYLKRQLRQLIGDDEVIREPLSDHVKSNLRHALNRVESAPLALGFGGLFTTFFGAPEKVVPELAGPLTWGTNRE